MAVILGLRDALRRCWIDGDASRFATGYRLPDTGS
jgi:hypothetical protein